MRKRTGLLLVCLVVLVGGVIWYSTRVQNTGVITPAQGKIFTNEQYGVRLEYPETMTLTADSDAPHNLVVKGDAVLTVLGTLHLDRSFLPQTNFSEALVNMMVVTGKDAEKNCRSLEGFDNSATTTINSVQYVVATTADAAAGNLYDVATYRAWKGGTCYVFENIVHSTNIGNYDPAMGIKEFDEEKVAAVLNRVMGTVEIR